jgi:predicted anti-sigma-YlaC factor YlaD
MWNLLKKNREACGQFQDELETAASAGSLAATPEELRAALTVACQEHASSCEECRASVEELLSARALLRVLPARSKTPAPWFAPRVMAAIAAKEAELRRLGSPWAAVPRFASRVALASAAMLLVVSTWVYQRPVAAPAKEPSVEAVPESLFDSSQPTLSQDDILVSLAERAQ